MWKPKKDQWKNYVLETEIKNWTSSSVKQLLNQVHLVLFKTSEFTKWIYLNCLSYIQKLLPVFFIIVIL